MYQLTAVVGICNKSIRGFIERPEGEKQDASYNLAKCFTPSLVGVQGSITQYSSFVFYFLRATQAHIGEFLDTFDGTNMYKL